MLLTLLEKNTSKNFTLNEERTHAFKDLVDTFFLTPALALPQLALKYSIDTDASTDGLGCSLQQTILDGDPRTFGNCSQALFSAKQNYSAPKRKCPGIVWGLKTLCLYHFYEDFNVQTDLIPLRQLPNIQEPCSRLMQWRRGVAKFNF